MERIGLQRETKAPLWAQCTPGAHHLKGTVLNSFRDDGDAVDEFLDHGNFPFHPVERISAGRGDMWLEKIL